MDVIEHLEKPQIFLNHINNYLRSGGYLIISVPTPLYPRVFGRRFHSEIGHLVDGYRLPELREIVPKQYSLMKHKYNTGLFSWLGCYLCYRYIINIKTHYIRLMLNIMLIPFKWIDILNGKKISASLVAVFRKA